MAYEELRFFHLGLDIIVPLGTPLCAPLDARVAGSGYEPGAAITGPMSFCFMKALINRFTVYTAI